MLPPTDSRADHELAVSRFYDLEDDLHRRTKFSRSVRPADSRSLAQSLCKCLIPVALRTLFLTHGSIPNPARCAPPVGQVAGTARPRGLGAAGFPNYPAGRSPGYQISWRQREGWRDSRSPRAALSSHDTNPLHRVANYGARAVARRSVRVREARRRLRVSPASTVGFGDRAARLRGIPFVYHIADMWPESVVESGLVVIARACGGGIAAARVGNRSTRAGRDHVLSPGFSACYRARRSRREDPRIYTGRRSDVPARAAHEALAKGWGCVRLSRRVRGKHGRLPGTESVPTPLLLKDRPDVSFVFVGTGRRKTTKASAQSMG